MRMAGMFIVVAIDAQQLPVAAVLGIVVVIMIAVMHGKFLQSLAGEFAPAAGADPGIKFQRPFAVGQRPRVALSPRPGDDVSCVSFVSGTGHTYRQL